MSVKQLANIFSGGSRQSKPLAPPLPKKKPVNQEEKKDEIPKP